MFVNSLDRKSGEWDLATECYGSLKLTEDHGNWDLHGHDSYEVRLLCSSSTLPSFPHSLMRLCVHISDTNALINLADNKGSKSISENAGFLSCLMKRKMGIPL